MDVRLRLMYTFRAEPAVQFRRRSWNSSGSHSLISVYYQKYHHLESYTPGQDQAKSYVLVCTSTYWYIPVPVRTGTYQYMPVQELHNGTYQYVLVRTRNRILGFLIHAGSAQRVNCNSVQLPCKRYDGMVSNFKKMQSSGNASQ